MATSISIKFPIVRNLDDHYRMVMDEYAEVGEGLLSRLVPGCPGGDFAHASYKWTPPQRLAWKLDRKAPCHINDLPVNPDLMMQSIHIPTEKDRIRNTTESGDGTTCTAKKKPVVDIRISKKQFRRLEQVAGCPGLRVWLSDVDPPHCMAIPSHIFVFTEEEKVKYRDDKFKVDGSDLPTLDGLIRRFESSGLGKIHGMGSASNGSDTMSALMEFARAQQSGN